MTDLSYREFFTAACGDGRTPYPYQERMACDALPAELFRRGKAVLLLEGSEAA